MGNEDRDSDVSQSHNAELYFFPAVGCLFLFVLPFLLRILLLLLLILLLLLLLLLLLVRSTYTQTDTFFCLRTAPAPPSDVGRATCAQIHVPPDLGYGGSDQGSKGGAWCVVCSPVYNCNLFLFSVCVVALTNKQALDSAVVFW
jgi:hypothetical protein